MLHYLCRSKRALLTNLPQYATFLYLACLPFSIQLTTVALFSALLLTILTRPRSKYFSFKYLINSPFVLWVTYYGLYSIIQPVPTPADTPLKLAWFSSFLLFTILLYIPDKRTLFHIVSNSLSLLVIAVSIAVLISANQQFASDTTINTRVLARFTGASFIIVPNDLTILAVALPFFLAAFRISHDSLAKCWYVCAILLALTAIIAAQSRTALLAYGVSFFVFFSYSANWRTVITLCLCLVLAVVLTDFVMGLSLLDKLTQSTLNGRFYLWLSGWELFLQEPLLGHGPHTYGTVYRDVLITLNPPGFLVNEFMPWPHNLFIEAAAETGLAGLILFCLCLFNLIMRSRDLINRAAGNILSYERIIHIAIIASALSFTVAACFDGTFMRLWVWLSIAILSAFGLKRSLPFSRLES